MGLADREYQRTERTGGGVMANLTPVVKSLLAINIAVFFIDIFSGHRLREFGAYTVESGLMDFHIWKLVTFQFLHGSLGHLLFNMFGLFFFGPFMERWWGPRKFLWFYLLCGSAGAVLFTVLSWMNIIPTGMESALIGASAGIYGILIGVGAIAPAMRVALLFPPIELSMRQFAIALLAIAAGMVAGGFFFPDVSLFWNAGGEAGHFGGAVLGYFLVRRPRLLGSGGPAAPRRSGPHEPKIRPRSKAFHDPGGEVDRILEKISRDGFQSLSDKERAVLQDASQRHKKQP
jgi:membrane associated rhomboid family serine protease